MTHLDSAFIDNVKVVSLISLFHYVFASLVQYGKHGIENVCPLVSVQVVEEDTLFNRLGKLGHCFRIFGDHLDGKKE